LRILIAVHRKKATLCAIMDKVRIGIIGTGGMGQHHSRSLLSGKLENMELRAVCDVDEARLANFPDQLGFTDSGELCRSGEVDAVIIATHHFAHTTLGIEALENGLHVLVEKPLSVHKADCERLIAAHRNPDQVFAAMFNQRTDPHYRKLRDLINRGELGEIRRYVWIITNWFRTEAYFGSGGWRATWAGEGGGVLMNQCAHQLDLLQWMFGMPEKVRAFCEFGRYHDIEVEDDVTAYLEYANGSKGVFITTTGESPGTNRLEVTGERGKVVLEGAGIDFTRNEIPMSEFSRGENVGNGRMETWDVHIDIDGRGGQHAEILQNFGDAILKGTPLIAPAAEGIRSVELMNSMLYSSINEATVELPLDGAAYETLLQRLIRESEEKKKVR